MVDTAISNFPAAAAVATTDLVPIVQSGVTKQATIAKVLANVPSGTTFSVAANGGDKTGATSSRAALIATISAASTFGGGRVVLDPGTWLIDIPDGSSTDTSITIPSNVTIAGAGPSSIVNFTCQTVGGYAFLFKFAGTNPGLENLKIQRGASLDGVMLSIGTSTGARISNVEFDGKIGSNGTTNYIHGMFLGQGNATNVRWVGGKAHHLTYPLLQSSPSTGNTAGFLVDSVEFYANTATDLEFNAPHSQMSGITVRNCYAHDQDTAAQNGGWFFVGLARVHDAYIHDNIVERYRGEPIHIEDGSYDVHVYHNTFRACALSSGLSYCQVISSSYRVWILDNDFDATANGQLGTPNYPYLIGLQAGGSGTTDGGNGFFPPYEVHVRGNHFHCYTANGIYVEGNARTTITGNRFKGTGDWDATALAYIGTNAGWGVDVVDGDGVIVANNDFEGIAYPIQRRTPSASNSTGSRSGLFTGNRVSKFKALTFINPERVTIQGNTMSRGEYPLITGQAGGVSKAISVTGNSAFDCKAPINVKGAYSIITKAAQAVGSGVTLTVDTTFIAIPSGVAFTFPNGAVFTTTTAANAGVTALTGNVTTAAVATASPVGTSASGSIPHSSSSPDNKVLTGLNLDTVAGIYA